MAGELSWRLLQAIREQAAAEGETIARAMGFHVPPVDPFKIIAEERRIFARGGDFGDAFDGRLEYQAPQFLLFYNTKYDRWPHAGAHHPKVRFTAGHELGHFYLDEHREFLRRGGGPHRSFSEFRSEPVVEQQADWFAAGLLMPEFLLGPVVNDDPSATLDAVKAAREQFDVSLTGVLVRWVQLSHFPCATICVAPHGRIKWGFVSEGFGRARGYRSLRGAPMQSPDARKFLAAEPGCTKFREGSGVGVAHHWIDLPCGDLGVKEYYLSIPYRQDMMVFVVGDEDEVASLVENDCDGNGDFDDDD